MHIFSDEIDCQSGEKLWAPLNWDLLEYMYLIEIFFSSDATRLPRKWWYQYCQCWCPNNYNLSKWKRWWEETKWPNHNHDNDPFHFNITTNVRYVKYKIFKKIAWIRSHILKVPGFPSCNIQYLTFKLNQIVWWPSQKTNHIWLNKNTKMASSISVIFADCPDQVVAKGFTSYSGLYVKQKSQRKIEEIVYQLENKCIWWHKPYRHWWIGECTNIFGHSSLGGNNGFAWLAPDSLCPIQDQSKELRQFNIYKMHSNFNLEF